MSQKTLPARIVDAFRSEDCDTIRALFRGNPEQVTAYTFFGGQTWLGYAAQIGKLNVVKTLVDIGLDVNAGDKRENSAPICSAADNGHYDIVKYLLDCGANMDVSLSVRNPLFAAIVGRSPLIVHLLLERGIDSRVRYNSKTMKNMDAVAFSLMRGERECARIIALWNAGGDERQATIALEDAALIAKENAYGSKKK